MSTDGVQVTTPSTSNKIEIGNTSGKSRKNPGKIQKYPGLLKYLAKYYDKTEKYWKIDDLEKNYTEKKWILRASLRELKIFKRLKGKNLNISRITIMAIQNRLNRLRLFITKYFDQTNNFANFHQKRPFLTAPVA